MEIRPLKMSDLDVLDLEDKVLFKKTITEENSYTVTFEDNIVFCAGISVLWDGVAEAWLCIADDSHPVSLVLTARRLLETVLKKHKLVRLQAIVREDNIKARKFVKVLGFERECVMEKLNKDRTNGVLYSLVL